MANEDIRTCNNSCQNYKIIKEPNPEGLLEGNYCIKGKQDVTILVKQDDNCLWEYKKLKQAPQQKIHPFGEWGRDPLPFP